MLYCAKRKNDVYTKQVFYANTECMKLSVVLFASRQFYLIWTFLTNFGPFFGPKEPNLVLYGQYLDSWCMIYAKDSRLCEKMVLFVSLRKSTWSLPFGPIFSQSFGPNGSTLALLRHYFDFQCIIYTQGWRLCGKVVLFAILGNSIWFWTFRLILAQVLAHMGQILPCKDQIWTFDIRFTLRA